MNAAGETLRGRRILVVEDEYFIADDVREGLERAGAEVVGPVPSLAEALDLARGEGVLDGAVLDVNLGGERVWPAAEALAARGVPVVLATGYDTGMIPPAHMHLTRCEKPVSAQILARAVARSLAITRSPDAVYGP